MQPYDQRPPPKSGMGPLGTVLIIFGVLALVGMATCGAGLYWVKRKVAKVAAEMADGGARLVLVSPVAVTDALTGAKKDYVGVWTSERGSTLTIDAMGNMSFEKDEDGDGVKEKLNMPIAAFVGNDIQCQAFVTLTVHVSQPPSQVSGQWHMTADGIPLER